ncbi:hypothetical protein [Pelagicoccus sp. SDUM812005]|uniref:hypothetical protein n=1 Tax=Pelagicoccus sp. SDUM812005 TaxID=3041257 RepID=UPI00280C575C|nr:hypothetical protein [Pelagicoccus sp. SDUM812005]MDQ8183836.1 hypothetical protein [Pelagicoccus sp. SDUM812005]
MPLESLDSNVFEKKYGGGCACLFGLPFFLAGLGVIVATILIAIGEIDGDLPLFFGLPFGGIFVAVGAGILFYRSGLRIDKGQGEVASWWGLLVPLRTKRYALGDIELVTITHEIRRSKNSSYSVYPVKLTLKKGGELKVTEERKGSNSRREAEAIAKFLEVDIVDRSGAGEVRRKHVELDMSVKDRFRKGLLRNDIPEVPFGMRSKVEFDEYSLSVKIPPLGFRPWLLVPTLGVAVFLAFPFFGMLLPFLNDQESVDGFSFLFVGFIALFMAAPLSFVLRMWIGALKVSESFQVDRHRLVHERGWLLKKRVEIEAEEIEELSSGLVRGNSRRPFNLQGHPIQLQSDRMDLKIGAHLEKEESEYIVALMKAVLVS